MNIERLQQAIAIIANIPDKQIRLSDWQTRNRRYFAQDITQTDCGTIACAAGWLCLHPEMNEQGLHASWCGSPRIQKPRAASPYDRVFTGYCALALFFDLPRRVAMDLFGPRLYELVDTIPKTQRRSESPTYRLIDAHLTDKALWLKRARAILELPNKEELTCDVI